jgi:UPF0176 protein
MPSHQVLLFYNYTRIADPKAELERQRAFCEQNELVGRVIIAHEGINATYEGKPEQLQKYISWLASDPRFTNTHFKLSDSDGNSFPKLSIKVRSELVSGHLGADDVDPNQVSGKHLTAEELHDWINSDKEFYVVDMRNDYEFQVGHFANSVLPSLTNFRDLPKVLPELEHLKNKTVVTVCTGGVRCEKASGYLVTKGFADVYQLSGGIHTYMEKYPNQDFLGQLYVFDGRVTMGFNVDAPEHVIVGKCAHCGQPAETIVDCSNIYCPSTRTVRHFICCDACLDNEGKPWCINCGPNATASR